ncbi:hypothetical protein FOCC_FOCC007642 [Frankliniella occidentalis]|nr:hypothetical protein FOCC_FOCC007642 [Frankliniella occidentalis]
MLCFEPNFLYIVLALEPGPRCCLTPSRLGRSPRAKQSTSQLCRDEPFPPGLCVADGRGQQTAQVRFESILVTIKGSFLVTMPTVPTTLIWCEIIWNLPHFGWIGCNNVISMLCSATVESFYLQISRHAIYCSP